MLLTALPAAGLPGLLRPARAQEAPDGAPAPPAPPATPAAVESRHDLRAAPPVAVGLITRRRLRNARSGTTKFSMSPKGEQQEQPIDQSFALDVEERVLALSPDGQPERVLRTYLRVSPGYGARERGEDEPLAGLTGIQVLVVRKQGREALARPDGAVLDDKLQGLLADLEQAEHEHRVPDVRLLLPAAPVAVGERWQLSREDVAKLLALAGGELDPDEVRVAEATLEATEPEGAGKDGGQALQALRVVFRLQLAISDLDGATFKPPGALELVVRYETTGAASHARSLVAEGAFRGTLNVEDTQGMVLTVDLRFSGEYVVEEVGTLAPALPGAPEGR